jgi:hypothetical protein
MAKTLEALLVPAALEVVVSDMRRVYEPWHASGGRWPWSAGPAVRFRPVGEATGQALWSSHPSHYVEAHRDVEVHRDDGDLGGGSQLLAGVSMAGPGRASGTVAT